MKIDENMNEQAICLELATRFKQTRISASLTREELADRSMVSVGTIARFENGKDISLSNLIKLMKALSMESRIESLISDPSDRPSSHIETYTPKQRARKKKTSRDWKWGDEK